MAKAPATESLFKIELGAPPPAPTRSGGGKASVYADAMKGMPVPKGDKTAQFFIVAAVPAAITDPAERTKAMKEEARKISNRLSGTARRLSDQKDTNGVPYAFALRTQTLDDGATVGVRVYRVNLPEPKPAPPVGKPPQS